MNRKIVTIKDLANLVDNSKNTKNIIKEDVNNLDPHLQLHMYKSNADKNGYVWSLDDAYAVSLLTSRCVYCDFKDINFSVISTNDNTPNFVFNNVSSCCKQ